MKKPIYSKQFIDKIKKLVEIWKDRCYLNGWSIHICFRSQPAEIKSWSASIWSDSGVREACLNIYPKFLDFDKEEYTNIIIHELSHIISNDFNDLFRDFVIEGHHVTKFTREKELEKMVCRFADAIENAYEHGLSNTKRKK